MYNTGLIPVYNNMAHWNKHDQFSYCNFLFPLCGYVKFFIIFILIRMSTFVIALLYTFHRQLFFIININTLYLIINKVSIAAILDLLQTVPLGDIFAENTSVKLFCDSLKASSSDRCFNTLAYNWFNSNGALYLFLKNTISHSVSTALYMR